MASRRRNYQPWQKELLRAYLEGEIEVVKPKVGPGSKKKRMFDISNNRRRRQLDRIYERDNAICWWCGGHVEREDASRDHINPLRYFQPGDDKGDHTIKLAHIECNNSRDQERRKND